MPDERRHSQEQTTSRKPSGTPEVGVPEDGFDSITKENQRVRQESLASDSQVTPIGQSGIGLFPGDSEDASWMRASSENAPRIGTRGTGNETYETSEGSPNGFARGSLDTESPSNRGGLAERKESGENPDDGNPEKEKDKRRRRLRTRIIVKIAVTMAPFVAILIAVLMLAKCISDMNPFSSSSGNSAGGAATSSMYGETMGSLVAQSGGTSEAIPRVNIDYQGLNDMFATASEDEGITPNTAGEEVADLAVSLALSAINSGDPNADLKRLGVYGNSPGQFTYGNEGRIHAHQPADDWDYTAYVPPDPKIPGAKEWIEFTGLNKGARTSISLPSTAGKTMDGTKNLGGIGVYADCAGMPWNVWHYFHSDLRLMQDFAEYAHITVKTASFGGRGVPATEMIGPSGVMEKERFTFIMTDASKTWEEQCQPGDILCNGTVPHYMLYVGNEIAQEYFPGTTGYICEAGHRSQAYWGVTQGQGYKPDGKNWFIARYNKPDDVMSIASGSSGGARFSAKSSKKSKGSKDGQGAMSGSLSDGSLSSRQQRIIAAAKSTGSPGGGLCAMWVSMVYQNAGLGYPGGNACDQYDWYCKSSNLHDLKPGMMVAVRQHNMTSAGSIYGHVGIYIGNGQLMDNIGYIRTMSVYDWINTYNAHAINCNVRWGWGA